jgi:hypothetical protein
MNIDTTEASTTETSTTDTFIGLADAWARMWTAQPALAVDLMTDDCVQWSADAPVLDEVVGPQQQERFIIAHRAKHVTVFDRRLLVADGDAFAYLWDVTFPDGSMKTGIDVNVVRDGLISENWTFMGEAYREEPDPAPGDSADRDELRGRAEEWANIRGFQLHRRQVVDAAAGRIVLMRTSGGVGGVDLLTLRDGTLETSWSITGVRAFRY